MQVLLTALLKVLYNVLMINTVSVTDLKQNTSQVVGKVQKGTKSLLILQRSKPAAVLVDPEYYSVLEQALEDLEDLRVIEERQNEARISLDAAAKKFRAK